MKPPTELDSNYSLHEKWGEALDDGFVVIPAALLRYQTKLQISDGELVVLMNLIMAWWRVSERPFPRTSTLAKRMGVSARTVQRHIERLEEKGFIRRVWASARQDTKQHAIEYDLKGTVELLKQNRKAGGRVQEHLMATVPMIVENLENPAKYQL